MARVGGRHEVGRGCKRWVGRVGEVAGRVDAHGGGSGGRGGGSGGGYGEGRVDSVLRRAGPSRVHFVWTIVKDVGGMIGA